MTAIQVSRTFLMIYFLNRHLEERRILHNKSLTKNNCLRQQWLFYTVCLFFGSRILSMLLDILSYCLWFHCIASMIRNKIACPYIEYYWSAPSDGRLHTYSHMNGKYQGFLTFYCRKSIKWRGLLLFHAVRSYGTCSYRRFFLLCFRYNCWKEAVRLLLSREGMQILWMSSRLYSYIQTELSLRLFPQM
jgi:hypothetical protein